MKVYQKIALTFNAYQQCIKNENITWQNKYEETIKEVIKTLPSGSGIDKPIKFDFEKSNFDKIILYSSYHVIDEDGYYDGWIDFDVIIKPDWIDFKMKIQGKFSNYGKCKADSIKNYIYDTFDYALNKDHVLNKE